MVGQGGINGIKGEIESVIGAKRESRDGQRVEVTVLYT